MQLKKPMEFTIVKFCQQAAKNIGFYQRYFTTDQTPRQISVFSKIIWQIYTKLCRIKEIVLQSHNSVKQVGRKL